MNARLIAAFVAVYLFWGATFLAIRYAVEDIPPLLMMALRCAGGAAILFGWLGWQSKLARSSAKEWITAAIAGGLLFLGCHSILAYAEQRVTSGQAALYFTGIPLWLVLLDGLRHRRAPCLRVILGLLLGVAGVAVLVDPSNALSGTLTDRILLILSAFSWAAGSIVGRDGPRPSSAFQAAAMQLACGSAALLLVSLAFGELGRFNPAAVSAKALLSLLFLIVCGTVLAFSAFTWLIRVTTPAAAGSYAFVNPIIALMLAWSVGDEPIAAPTLIAAALVITAIALTRPRGYGRAQPAPAQVPADA